jgi:hypothetical protein
LRERDIAKGISSLEESDRTRTIDVDISSRVKPCYAVRPVPQLSKEAGPHAL